ncbi:MULTISPECIES: alpha/beta hydrolase [unclassified Halorhabdus]|uniref:alpha/beta hydrolase n=1 Tax=unclassified Halorhabdus TaxID=2621901 RepID=UPI0023D9E4C8|nr:MULTISPECIES: alpha/beta hydrolase [unclassified Halorhabdus]WEL17128.1 Alpha/beta superfamily hydrolase [Halorhabdus sp. SVX81]WEL21014.1 Alpha/beta hydrolase [Halorhabdus sp. BNX81]
MRADDIHPQAQAVVDRQRRLGISPISDHDRRVLRFLQRVGTWFGNRDPPAVGSTTDGSIPGPDGDLPVRLYRPDAPGPYPTIVFFHGGGFVLGSIGTHDWLCRQLTRETGAVVVSVEYRLAPEHPFPAAVEDAYAATQWAADNPDRLASDGTLAVAGDSAGGNLAAVVSLMARDRGEPTIDYQTLLYPGIGISDDQESVRENDGIVLSIADLEWFENCYYDGEIHQRNPYADPAAACDLAGVAPATVVTAGFDPLRDGGVAYADQLDADGVEVTHRHYPGMIHGFATSPGIDRAETVVSDVATDFADTIGETS